MANGDDPKRFFEEFLDLENRDRDPKLRPLTQICTALLRKVDSTGQNAVGSERCVAIKAACATELGQHQNSDPNSTVKSEFEAIAEAPTLVTYKLSKAEMKRKPARHGGNNIMLMFRVP